MVEERELHGEGPDRKRKKGDLGRAEFLYVNFRRPH